jgi:hypothetical protein
MLFSYQNNVLDPSVKQDHDPLFGALYYFSYEATPVAPSVSKHAADANKGREDSLLFKKV